jgi:H+-translocating NAD(P) transhydrogenase subunit alpha
MTLDSVVQLARLGHSVCIQSGAWAKAGLSDATYAAAVIAAADVIVKVRGPEAAKLGSLRDGQTLIS